jgi:hypothetical protein
MRVVAQSQRHKLAPIFTTHETEVQVIIRPFKGLMTSEDAEKSIAAGVSGVIVTTHGGQSWMERRSTPCPTLPTRWPAAWPTRWPAAGQFYSTETFAAAPMVSRRGARRVRGAERSAVLVGSRRGGRNGRSPRAGMFCAELELVMAVAGCPTLGAITRSLVPTHR